MTSHHQGNLKSLNLEETLSYLPVRARDTHKGQLGHVLVIGGDYGMGGAIRLAGEAALRTGAGRVSVATRLEHSFSMIGSCPELMCHGIQEAAELAPLLQRATVIVLGPGLGQSAWGKGLFELVLESHLPLVIDADALNILADKKFKRDHWILTPHPGEAARLLNKTPQEIQHNRLASIQDIQNRFGGVIVLKGADSLVLGRRVLGSGSVTKAEVKTEAGSTEARSTETRSTEAGSEVKATATAAVKAKAEIKPEVCHLGNPGMATAGMGDVLSGILGALIAQGLSLEEAAKLGVCLHATAGDKVAMYAGERGMKASDLFSMIQICLNPTT